MAQYNGFLRYEEQDFDKIKGLFESIRPFDLENKVDLVLLELFAQMISKYKNGERVTDPDTLELMHRADVSDHTVKYILDKLIWSIRFDHNSQSLFPRSGILRQ